MLLVSGYAPVQPEHTKRSASSPPDIAASSLDASD